MCLAARGQKKFSSNGFCYVREENFHIPSQPTRLARESPHRRWCRRRKTSACPPSGRGTPGNRPTAGGVGEECFRLPSPPTGDARELLPPQGVCLAARDLEAEAREENSRIPSQPTGVAREPPHRRWQASAPHFPQVVDRGRAGILQWRKQRRTKGEWSHEAGTDRTRTLRLQQ